MLETVITLPEPEAPPEFDGGPVALTPPEDRAAEEAVLGSVLIDPGCYPEVAGLLKPADFYIRRHAWIWQAFENLTARSEPLDLLTIEGELNRMSRLSDVGGPAFLTALLNQVPSSLNAPSYARAVKDRANKRRLLDTANELATLAYDPRVTAEQASARAIEAIQENVGSTQGRYEIYTGTDALQPQPPTEWVVRNLIQTNSVNVIYGDPGSKKTWTALHLAACVANGLPWLNYTTVKMPVLFIDEESGQARIKDRLGKILRGMGCTGENIFIVSFAGFRLDNPADVIELENLIKRTGAGLVIPDALADMMVGDENTKQDVQPVFTALRRISDATGAASVIVHHSGKNGDYRGSSAIKGAVDLMLEVASKDDSPLVAFKTTKNRDGDQVKFAATASWEDDLFTLTATNYQAARIMSKGEDYVMRFFDGHPDGTIEECESNADTCSAGTARNTLFALAKRGVLHRTNTGKIATYALSVTSNERVTDE
jgi:hypothetical protein